MAGEEKPEASKGAKGGFVKRSRILIGGFVLLLAGVAAGTGLWTMRQSTTQESITLDASKADVGQALLPLGRITVNVAAAGALSEKRSRYLVIEPTLLYDAAFDQDEKTPDMETHQAALRDSFIEYLSQLHENDVYGSAGLADLRQELLRRAKLVIGSEAPMGILLQDFVLQ